MSNIMFNDRVFNTNTINYDGTKPMTAQGTALKTFLLLGLAVLSACYTWNLAIGGFVDKLYMMMTGGAIAAFICAIVGAFKPQYSKPLSLCYALCEGLVLGGISVMFGPIALEAVIATFITVFSMLILYSTRIIKATPLFKKVLFVALISIIIFYGLGFLLSVFHLPLAAFLVAADNNIFVRLLITGVAAFFLIIDFDQIENFSNNYFPNYLEWYCAMSLMITIVWLYIEILKTLGSRR